MIGGYVIIDATGVDISNPASQSVTGLSEKLTAAVATKKPILITGLVDGSTEITPTFCSVKGNVITVNGTNIVVDTTGVSVQSDPFGLGIDVTPAAGETFDWDTVLTPGRYRISAQSPAGTVSNAPTTGRGYVVEVQYTQSSNYITQIAYTAANKTGAEKVFIRHYRSGAASEAQNGWSDWATWLDTTPPSP